MFEKFQEGLSYEDVLLEPRYSEIKSRKDVSLETQLSKNIKINIPLVSSNMDTVTESQMAIALAQVGGIGIIHRFTTLERQLEEVRKVKRFTNYVVERPFTINKEQKIREYKELSEKLNVSSFPVLDEEGFLVGIVTHRDIVLQRDMNKKIKEVMTPKEKLITAHCEVSLEEAQKLFEKYKIEKLPLVNKNEKLCGLITAKDIQKNILYPNVAHDKKGRLLVGAAVGVAGDFQERAEELIKNEVDVLVVDIAHGHSLSAMSALKILKRKLNNQDMIVGNVATEEGTRDLIRAGADAIKVGVGPGSTCTTRIMAGAGVPQLTAVLNCAEIAQKYRVPIIADGGITKPADVVKALAAGASTVMIGNLFAGTDESPGRIITKNGKRYKLHRGMASFGATISRRSLDTDDENLLYENLMVEGTEGLVPYRGKVKEVIDYLLNGLRSGMSYLNSKTIKDLKKNAKFIRITESSLRESYPHDLERVD